MVQSVVIKMALTVLTMTSLTYRNTAGWRIFVTDKAHAGQGAPIFGAGVYNAPGDQAGGRTIEQLEILSLKGLVDLFR